MKRRTAAYLGLALIGSVVCYTVALCVGAEPPKEVWIVPGARPSPSPFSKLLLTDANDGA